MKEYEINIINLYKFAHLATFISQHALKLIKTCCAFALSHVASVPMMGWAAHGRGAQSLALARYQMVSMAYPTTADAHRPDQ